MGLLAISSEVEGPLWPNFAVKPPVSGEFRMKPLYAAWLGDLGPGDLVEVECVCGHSQALTASMLATAGMGSPTRRSWSCSAASGAGSAMSGGRWWCRSDGRWAAPFSVRRAILYQPRENPRNSPIFE